MQFDYVFLKIKHKNLILYNLAHYLSQARNASAFVIALHFYAAINGSLHILMPSQVKWAHNSLNKDNNLTGETILSNFDN